MEVEISNLQGFKDLMNTATSADIYKTSIAYKEKVDKDMVIAYPADKSGCGNIRIINPMNYLNSTGIHNTITSSRIIHRDDDILKCVKTLWFQRPYSIDHAKEFISNREKYNKLKVKTVIDHDDMLFGKNEKQGGTDKTGVPSYNLAWQTITEKQVESHIEVMNLVDRITVSTPYLGTMLKSSGVTTETFVLPNVVPMYLWGKEKRVDLVNPIKKPKVLYTGAPLHYDNYNKQKGDFEGAWYEWLMKSIKEDKIELFIFGVEVPWFLKSVAHKIHLLKFCNYLDYPNVVRSVKANLGIAPLVENDFNKSKSDIKFLEYASCGIPFLGTRFEDGNSPYEDYNTVPVDVSVEGIQSKFEEMMDVPNYNAIKNWQYKYLVDKGRYLESEKYIKLLKEALFL